MQICSSGQCTAIGLITTTLHMTYPAWHAPTSEQDICTKIHNQPKDLCCAENWPNGPTSPFAYWLEPILSTTTELRGLRQRTNYTNRATAACRRS
jgi:hypothetical protein